MKLAVALLLLIACNGCIHVDKVEFQVLGNVKYPASQPTSQPSEVIQ